MRGIDAHLHVLQQGSRLLALVDPQQYRAVSRCGFSIGAQFRHLLDHYRCFLAGWPEGVVDYARRARDPRLETRPDTARLVHDEVIRGLTALPEADGPVGVRCDEEVRLGSIAPSSLYRELDFLLSHTVHHHALIAVLCAEMAIPLGPGFGVAPATLRFRRQQAATGS